MFKNLILTFCMSLFIFISLQTESKKVESDDDYIKNIKGICKSEKGELISFHKEYFIKEYRKTKSDKFKIFIVCEENKNEAK